MNCATQCGTNAEICEQFPVVDVAGPNFNPFSFLPFCEKLNIFDDQGHNRFTLYPHSSSQCFLSVRTTTELVVFCLIHF